MIVTLTSCGDHWVYLTLTRYTGRVFECTRSPLSLMHYPSLPFVNYNDNDRNNDATQAQTVEIRRDANRKRLARVVYDVVYAPAAWKIANK